MCPSSLSYCTDSYCLSGIILLVSTRGPIASAVEALKLDCTSSPHWEPVRWKTVENEGGCGPLISSPKIEVRKKMAHSSISRPLEQSTAADPSETPAVGWRDADQ